MKKMKKILSLLLAGVLAFGSVGSHVYAANSAKDGNRPEDGVTKDQPFASGTGTSSQFRIPCLVTLDDGTIVAGCDARWNWQMDGGGLDTIVSRSKDNGKTWHYTFANYLGDNGNVANQGSTAFIDPAMATDGETVWMIADLYPAGVALNGAHYAPKTGHTGYDANHNLALAAVTDSVNGNSHSDQRAKAAFDYHLEKIAGADDHAEAYYEIKDAKGNTVEGYKVDAFFNIQGNGVDTNLFCGDSPYFVYPTDFLYMTKSTDGGATWSIPTLIDVKGKEEQSLLVGPGRGIVTESGRLVFTAYEFTGRDIASCCIYSDDGGKTWQRGADVPEWSSEAVVTEADGRLYMFTRHGNAYYTSTNGGETWSEKKNVGIPYWHNCQLSAITYSEKIDGKTAIIFSAPSSTSGRNAGKLFVGLVQEDGRLDWAYEYSVNGAGDAYAYSCLDECLDGSIALLYEGGSCPITYENIAIEDIAKGAHIGEAWITDAEGNAVSSVMMQSSGEAQTFTVHGAPADAVVNVSKENVVNAVYENGTLTVSPAASVKGYHRVAVTVAGATLHVEVTDADITDSANYEKVALGMGETKTYTDESGNYADAVDRTNLDTNIATVEVTGEELEQPSEPEQGELQGQLATAAGQFNGEKVDVKDCLYTFTEAEGENNYTISAKAPGDTTVYLAHRSGSNVPNKTESAVIAVNYDAEKNGFTLQDTSTSAGANGSYLYFHKDNNAKLHFDRNGSVDGNGRCHFELYKASETAEDSPIAGYEKVTEVTAGEKYLIAAKSTDHAYYILRPFAGGANFNHVAKVLEPVAVPETVKVQLGTDANYNGDKVSLKSCLYTFAKADAENTYTISGTTAENQTAYLSVNAPSAGYPQKDTAVNIEIAYDEGQKAFTLRDKNGGDRYLYFYTGDENERKLTFDKWGAGSKKPEVYFELYVKSADAPEDSDIAGYKKLASLAEVENGGKYLITTKATDGNVYLLHPSLSTSDKYSHVGKVVEEQLSSGSVTTIEITGVAEGETSVKVGEKTYLISVKNEIKNVTLKVGESFTVAGKDYQASENQTAVTFAPNTDKAPYVKQTEIQSGKKYLIGQGGHVMVNRASKLQNPNGMDMEALNLNSGKPSDAMWWTVTQTDGGWTLQDADHKYLSFSGSNVALSDTEQKLTIGNGPTDGFAVSYGGQYLNNYGRANNRVAGYGANDNDWYFYAPVEGTVITGKTAGQTTDVIVGGTTYHISVICGDGEHQWGDWTENRPQSCTEHGTKEHTCTVCGRKEVEILPAGHDFGEWKVETEATCEKTGVEKRSCSRCDFSETRETALAEHKWEAEKTTDKEPTCTEAGTKSTHCTVCGTVKEGTEEEIPAKGHAWSNWYTVTKPTSTTEGLEERICTRQGCAEKETRAIAKLDPPSGGNQGGNSGNTDQPGQTPDNPPAQPQGNAQGQQTPSQGNTETAKTGDESNAGMYLVLMVVAAAAAGGFFFWKKKKDADENKEK